MTDTAKLKSVPRHSVDGYGRQDICYNDPEGEFVFYRDYEALKDALEAAQRRIADLEESHKKLRETMAAIHNTIRADGAYTPLAAIMSGVKRAYEESDAAAGINLETGG